MKITRKVINFNKINQTGGSRYVVEHNQPKEFNMTIPTIPTNPKTEPLPKRAFNLMKDRKKISSLPDIGKKIDYPKTPSPSDVRKTPPIELLKIQMNLVRIEINKIKNDIAEIKKKL